MLFIGYFHSLGGSSLLFKKVDKRRILGLFDEQLNCEELGGSRRMFQFGQVDTKSLRDQHHTEADLFCYLVVSLFTDIKQVNAKTNSKERSRSCQIFSSPTSRSEPAYWQAIDCSTDAA